MEVLTVLISLVVHIFAKRAEKPEADTAQDQRADMMNRLQDLLFSLWEKEACLYSKHTNLKYFMALIAHEREWWLSEWEQEWKQCAEAVSQKESRIEGLIQERDRLELEQGPSVRAAQPSVRAAQPGTRTCPACARGLSNDAETSPAARERAATGGD